MKVIGFTMLPMLLAIQLANAALIQPDSATASSEFSFQYDINYTIDGSGLPANFTVLDAHADYNVFNHWTTQVNQVPGNSSASFLFSSAVNLDAFYLWNHRSNNIAASPLYGVTDFDLEFYDSGNSLISSISGLAAVGGISTAQIYNFLAVSNVSRVDFIINSNEGLEESLANNFTGVAEVAFNSTTVPLPAALWLFGSAVVGLLFTNKLKRA